MIEVKGTIIDSGTVHITGSEFKEMQRYENRYRLFRVVNAGESNAEIKQLKNPAQAIHSNELAIQKN